MCSSTSCWRLFARWWRLFALLASAKPTNAGVPAPNRRLDHRKRRRRRRQQELVRSTKANSARVFPKKDQTLYFMRHGLCKHNVDNKARWNIDPGLTPDGAEQVRKTAEARFSASEGLPQIILTSPLLRTIETTLKTLQVMRGQGIHPLVIVTPLLSESWSARCDTCTTTGPEDLLAKISIPHARHWQWHHYEHMQQDCFCTPLRRAPGEGVDSKAPFTHDNGSERVFPWPITSASENHLQYRLDAFCHFLGDRPEQRILVVGHGGFFSRLLQKHLCNAEVLCIGKDTQNPEATSAAGHMRPHAVAPACMMETMLRTLGLPSCELAPKAAEPHTASDGQPLGTAVRPSASPLYHRAIDERLHIFVDNTNICVGAQKLYGTLGLLMGTDPTVRVHAGMLAGLVEGGRRVQERRVVGSECAQAGGMRRQWEEAGYKVGRWGGAGPESDVDDALQALMLTSVRRVHFPSHTLVLLSGDGNSNYGKCTFPLCVETGLRNGWRVELWAWKNATNKRYNTLQHRFPLQFSLRWLDRHRNTITHRSKGPRPGLSSHAE